MTTIMDARRWRLIAEAQKPGPYLVCNEDRRDWWAVAVRSPTGAWVTDEKKPRALPCEPTHFMSLPLPPRAALDPDAFWALVKRGEEDECWAWRGPVSEKSGHGLFRVGRRLLRPYRIAWALHYGGDWPPDTPLARICENDLCTNPRHIEPDRSRHGTYQSRRRDEPSTAAKNHCKKGHLLSGSNLVIRYNDGRPVRVCKKCRVESVQRYRERNRMQGSSSR